MREEVYNLKGRLEEIEKKAAQQEKEIEKLRDQVRILQERSKPFKKPTYEQVSYFFSAEGLPDEAENFYNFYESKDWKVGKTKMKNWKLAAQRWIKKNKPAPTQGYLSDI